MNDPMKNRRTNALTTYAMMAAMMSAQGMGEPPKHGNLQMLSRNSKPRDARGKGGKSRLQLAKQKHKNACRLGAKNARKSWKKLNKGVIL